MRRASSHAQEDHLDRPGEGTTPRHRPARSPAHPSRPAKLIDTGEGDVKRLQDIEPPEFRLRVGDYRVCFHDFGEAVEVTGVKHRREAYR